MKACSRRLIDRPIDIPAVQAAVMERAYRIGLSSFPAPAWNGKRVAVIGAGPAGLGAASVLAQQGYEVILYDKRDRLGGMVNLIPGFRLASKVARSDLDFLKRLGRIRFRPEEPVEDPVGLRKQFDALIVCAGLEEPIRLNIPGEEQAVLWQDFLEWPGRSLSRLRVAVLGGGAVAVDCATTAKRRGAAHVELVYRRKLENMPLTGYERRMLLEHGIEISTCCRPLAIEAREKRVKALRLARLMLPAGKAPDPKNFVVVRKGTPFFREFDLVISAVGSRARWPMKKLPGVFYAGDMVGSATVVEALATGKNAALEADAYIKGAPRPRFRNRKKSRVTLAGANRLPVPIEADFFGRKILSPFLLSAAPHTDGYAQMRKAFARGWAGGVMKTAFDNLPIHIPSEYMTVFGPSTYGNCDNVSGHPLDRVCREVERLVKEFPDRLALASTGGPVTGRDESDKAVWQSNTRKLESAGAMGVEYSLSCPQGGDGTAGDIVSQNAELTAKVIGWVMEASSDDNPKLFKLTGAVTAIRPIIRKIQEVFSRYPGKKVGVTLANSFPSLAFRQGGNRRWEEGVVVGMSGEGVLPISNLTLAKVADLGVVVSGNGGPMDYRAAANFLALGARTVQFCTIVMKFGLGIVDDLQSGLSHLMQDRGFRSVNELIGSALPGPITDFLALSSVKKLPEVKAVLCAHCGNCTRCPYQAITLDRRKVPRFDPALCIGCSLCAQKCFAGAISMRPRTGTELEALQH